MITKKLFGCVFLSLSVAGMAAPLTITVTNDSSFSSGALGLGVGANLLKATDVHHFTKEPLEPGQSTVGSFSVDPSFTGGFSGVNNVIVSGDGLDGCEIDIPVSGGADSNSSQYAVYGRVAVTGHDKKIGCVAQAIDSHTVHVDIVNFHENYLTQ